MLKKIYRQSVGIIAALLVPILPFVIVGELPGERWLSWADEDALLFGLTGSGLLMLDILLPVPSSIIGTVLGARLGFWPGVTLTWAGLITGNMVGYWLARLASIRLRSWFPDIPDTTSLVMVFLSRPVPVGAEAMVLTAGATRVPVTQFFLACAAGNAIYAIVLAGNGATLIPDALAGPGLVVPMLLPVLAWLVWRRLATAQ
jgi:uncharacterized membrane protein YdjX (TVP38/TMEM64 family)